MERTITVIRGTTNLFNITVTDATGSLYLLGDGEFLRFGVKNKPEDEEYLIEKTITEGVDGVYTVELAPEDTSAIPYDRYVYDVGLQSGNHYYNIIPANAFVIKPNVTKWGDAV